MGITVSLEQRAKAIIADVFRIKEDSVNENTNMDNTPGWDSLGHLRLVLALESEFGITIEPEDLVKMTDYKVIIHFLKLYTKK